MTSNNESCNYLFFISPEKYIFFPFFVYLDQKSICYCYSENMRVTRRIFVPLLTKALYKFGCFSVILILKWNSVLSRSKQTLKFCEIFFMIHKFRIRGSMSWACLGFGFFELGWNSYQKFVCLYVLLVYPIFLQMYSQRQL